MASDMFSCLPYISLCETCGPRGLCHFGPVVIIMNKIGRGSQGDVVYHILRLWGLQFQTRRFVLCFSYISLSKTCDPQDGAIFGLIGIICTNLLEVH